MKHLKYLTISLILLFTFVGCDKLTDPEETIPVSANSSGQPMPKFANSTNIGGVMATILYEIPSTFAGVPAVSLTMGYSSFGKLVDAGTVMVNDNTLGKNTTGGKVFYMTPSAGSVTGLTGVYFNISYHNWSVSGKNDIPTISGRVSSPRKFNVSTPTANSTISKANDLKVTWTGGSSSSTEKILLVLIALDKNKTSFTAEELANNGSYTIPSSKLSSGKVMLQVVKYRYATVSKSDKDYIIVSEIVKTVNFKIN